MYLYEDEQELVKLREELESWIGTKYRHRCFHKGLACDCIGFIASVLVNLGIVNYDFKKMPKYPRDWHCHNTRSLLYEELLKNVDCEPVEDIKDGDLLLFNFAKSAGHIGFYLDGFLYESVDKIGVYKTLFKNSVWKDRVSNIMRIKSKAGSSI